MIVEILFHSRRRIVVAMTAYFHCRADLQLGTRRESCIMADRVSTPSRASSSGAVTIARPRALDYHSFPPYTPFRRCAAVEYELHMPSGSRRNAAIRRGDVSSEESHLLAGWHIRDHWFRTRGRARRDLLGIPDFKRRHLRRLCSGFHTDAPTPSR